MDTEVIRGARVSHERGSVDQIEAAAGESARGVVESLLAHDGIKEAFALQTCNRAEAYVVADSTEAGRAALSLLGAGLDDGSVVIEMGHEESLRHLMRVAAGLESLVIGEDQILGQFKRAVEVARGAGGLGPTLETGLTKAVHVGERARTETVINDGATSIGTAAVRLAERETALEGATALVVGAGEMGKLAATALADAGIGELIVANRTIPHAEHVANSVDADARAISLDDVEGALTTADVVVTATDNSEYVVDADDVAAAGETLVVDLAQPRDVDPAAAEAGAVEIRDMDDLQAVTAETHANRKTAAREVEAMIDAEFDRLLDEYKRRQADEAIGTMYEAAERIKAREVETAVSQLEAAGELTDEQREAVKSMADALVGQLLAAPTKSLREAAAEDDWETIRTAMQLFDPGFGDGAPSGDGTPEGAPDGIPIGNSEGGGPRRDGGSLRPSVEGRSDD
jgi:glutamyl-tRNA reductase